MSNAAKRWFSAAELAGLALDGFPATKAGMLKLAAKDDWQRPGWEGTRWRGRAERGGGVEYHVSILPPLTQARVLARHPDRDAGDAAAADPAVAAELDRRWRQATTRQRAEAEARLAALRDWRDMQHARPRVQAALAVMQAHAIRSIQTLYAWERLVDDLPDGLWLAALLPLSRASARPADLADEAWNVLRADYLRPERPSFDACLRRLRQVAAERGWVLPSARTLRRRIDAIPLTVRTLARGGREALMRMRPAQERDRAVFQALEAVNADGHKWDVFVRWPGVEKPVRPVMVAFQDLFSGKILAWRFDRSENRHAVRLALADLVTSYGIPRECWLDNGRNFASKWISGGTPTRYRFKVRDEEPDGLLKLLGVTVHWTTPYSGQSKPIERAFRDFAGDVAKHPRFAGAWVGNHIDAKPENYASKAVPLDVFIATVDEAVREHNARTGRRSAVCAGRSFDETFAASYTQNPVLVASEAQRDLLLLAAEQVRTRADNAIHFMGNRYFAPFLIEQRKRALVMRFDPDALHEGVRVYGADGRYLGVAECMQAVGFNSTEAGRELARSKKAFLKAERAKLDAERKLSIEQVAALLPRIAATDPPEARVVRPLFDGAAARAAAPIEEQSEQEAEMVAAIRRLTTGHLRLVEPAESED